MIIEFRKWGNSLAVRIPKALADAIKASDGKRAEMKVENRTLVLRPIAKPARKSRYTLEELLSGMTRDNVPQDVDCCLALVFSVERIRSGRRTVAIR
jgi:antitoxin MazE